MKVIIELLEKENITGFDLGNITFIGNKSTISSSDKNRSQPMMIFISIVDLLDGLSDFVTGNKQKYEFVGTDCSFILWFKKNGNNIIVMYKDQIISISTPKKLLTEIYESILDFFKKNPNIIPNDDIAYKDIQSSLQEFDFFLQSFK